MLYLLYLGWEAVGAAARWSPSRSMPAVADRWRWCCAASSSTRATRGDRFILAVLPQFLDTSRPMLAQYLLMTLTMVGVDLVVMAGYTLGWPPGCCGCCASRPSSACSTAFGGLFGAAATLLATVRRAAH